MKYLLSFILFISISFSEVNAQDDAGIEFNALLTIEQKPVPGAKVTIYEFEKSHRETNPEPFKKLVTNKKGEVERIMLPFNKNYKIVFNHKNCAEMFLTIEGKVEKKYEKHLMGFQAIADLIDTTKNKSVTLKKFNYPYTKAIIKGDKIMDDETYRKNFENGVITEMENDLKREKEKLAKENAEKQAALAKKRKEAFEAAKRKIKLMGSLLFADKQRTKAIANKKISLINTKGEVLQTTTTSAFGSFVFTELPSDEQVMVRIDEPDPAYAGTKIMITNRNGKEIQTATADAKGAASLGFKKADLTSIALMTLDENKNKTDVKGKFLTGDDKNTPISGSTVKVLNTKGETLKTTTTDATGKFVFTELPTDQNYMVTLDSGNDPKFSDLSKIVITDEKGNVLKEISAEKGKGFSFEFLPADNSGFASMKIDDTELKVDFKGKLINGNNNSPITNTKINLLNEKNVLIMVATSDASGNFSFERVTPDNYHMNIDAKDAHLPENTKVVIANENGKKVSESVLQNGSFNFEFLPAEQVQLTQIYFDDPWLQLTLPKSTNEKALSNLVVRENVYFNAADHVLLPDAKRALDKVIDIMLNVPNIKIELGAHTDAKGSDQYNMQLSEKRAKSAVDYIVANGIPVTRIKGKGYGETKLINKCGNNTECPEEEHAKNRRIEFNVTLQ